MHFNFQLFLTLDCLSFLLIFWAIHFCLLNFNDLYSRPLPWKLLHGTCCSCTSLTMFLVLLVYLCCSLSTSISLMYMICLIEKTLGFVSISTHSMYLKIKYIPYLVSFFFWIILFVKVELKDLYFILIKLMFSTLLSIHNFLALE